MEEVISQMAAKKTKFITDMVGDDFKSTLFRLFKQAIKDGMQLQGQVSK